ncbi:short chain dehydrogenase reductase family superfamily [Colletotrichum truncatum]|uniref:Short chain dehydrogenase reductase family superfamily n=1 Tax=Colletotrichum truncatum TaxID=5467 RepID=A0ACC3YZX0_COLTU|nr:short chain dehydrogenase reductase family superfamily [Colletotrichum truncatum]KAF6800867.1 short chain dehydrogenase reductase family superfamily [Colletotrichum truncatum]
MSPVLIVGATRGLGASLIKQYAAKSGTTVYGTTRSKAGPEKGFPESVKWLPEIDLMKSDVADHLVSLLGGSKPLSTVVITAGYFATEDLSADKGPNWSEEQRMYTTSSIAPVFIVHALLHAGLLQKDSKIVLVSSESGSITLRHEKEGGGNYAHHASKAALNMVGKLLSLDLKDKGVIVSIVHPGFMRTEMTKGVGFDKHWDDGGGESPPVRMSLACGELLTSKTAAVTPDEAAESLVAWTDKLDISKTGEYWAPRGPGDIGTAEAVLGKGLSTPLHLPW